MARKRTLRGLLDKDPRYKYSTIAPVAMNKKTGRLSLSTPSIIREPLQAALGLMDSANLVDPKPIYVKDLVNFGFGSAATGFAKTAAKGQIKEALDPNNGVSMFFGRKSKTANLKTLAQAERMDASGKSRKDIWDKTGWFKGRDKQWRYEVADRAFKLQDKKFDRMSKQLNDHSAKAPVSSDINPKPTLDEALKFISRYNAEGKELIPVMSKVVIHDKLFASYPSIKDTRIVKPNGMKSNEKGFFQDMSESGMQKRIGLNKNMSNEDARSTLLHEAQHNVQFLEGFAAGGSPHEFRKMVNNPASDVFWKPESRALFMARKELRNSPEFKKQSAAAIQDHAPFAKNMDKPYDDFLTVGAKTKFNPKSKEFIEADKVYKAAEKKNDDLYKSHVQSTYPLLKKDKAIEIEMKEKGIPLFEPPGMIRGQQAYHQLSGEVEARLVQKRLNYTMKERREKLPWLDQDVHEKHMLIRISEMPAKSTATMETIKRKPRTKGWVWVKNSKKNIANGGPARFRRKVR